MRATKIRLGFHRLGLVLAAIPILIAVGALYARSISYDLNPENYQLAGTVGFGVAAFLYAACRALGWVIAGFMGMEMTPEQIHKAKQLLEEHEELISICDDLQKGVFSVRIGGSKDLKQFYPEAIYRVGKVLWDEFRVLAEGKLEGLAELGVDVSKYRKWFKELSEWRPTYRGR